MKKKTVTTKKVPAPRKTRKTAARKPAARRKAPALRGSKNQPVRKITKTGTYTYYVTIPKSLIDQLGWREKQKVVVVKEGDTLVVRDWK
ncbi:MAG: AbrB/MazE/SpoVT family DNA-binding domain-containing protein [Opitutaceae bacterium]